MRRTARAAATLALGLALVAGLAACSPPDAGQEVEFRVPVTVREVATGTVEDRIVTTGALRAPELVTLRAETSGILRTGRNASGARLAEGDSVRAGQVIAEVTGEDVRLAARAEPTRQRYESAQRDYDSKKSLLEQGLLSPLEFRTYEVALSEAKMEWERSRLTESRSRLVTPIAGVILKQARDEQGLPLADGQLVAQGTVLAQVAFTGTLVADVDLVGPDVGRVRPGQMARVRYQAAEGEPHEGRVQRLSPTIDPQTRALRAEVLVPNPAGALRPGMFVEVTIVAERRENVTVVPREAVTERDGKSVVFLLDGQSVKRRDVALGVGDDAIVEVREGLAPGERIVVRGLETLTDGAKVRVSGA